MIKIRSVTPDSESELADFRLVDGKVEATYHSPSFERQMKRGIWTAKTGDLTPADGQAFLDALPIAYANSSMIEVTEVADRADGYNPDQPRAENGQFGEGGSSSSKKSSGRTYSADETKDGNTQDIPDEDFTESPEDAAAREHWRANEDGDKGPDAEPDLYHVTSVDRAESIESEGLRPGARKTIGNGGMYEQHSAGRTFLTDKEGLSFWTGRAEDHLFDQHDDPPEVIVYRVRSKDLGELEEDAIGSEDAGADAWITKKPINPRSLVRYKYED